MVAATQDISPNNSKGELLAIPVAAGARILSGTLVCTNAAGYAVAGADTAGYVFEGVADAGADNRLGQDGDIVVVVHRSGFFQYDCVSPTDQSAMAATAYIKDDKTLADDSDVTNDVACGRIVKVPGDGTLWIVIDDYTEWAARSWAPATTTAGATTAAPTTEPASTTQGA